MDNLHSAFWAAIDAAPDRPAIFWGADTLTYDELGQLTANAIARLSAAGAVGPGDRVALWLKNRPEFIVCLFASLSVGAVVVPVNTFYKAPEAAHLLNDCGATVLITEAAFREGAEHCAAGNPSLRVVDVEELRGGPGLAQRPLLAPRGRTDVAILIYTSGTTGHPKGVMLSHGNLLENVASCQIVLRVVDFDRFGLVLPLFHSFMLTVCVLLPLLSRGSIVLVRSVNPPKAIVQELIVNRATIFPAMAALFRVLSSLPPGIQLPFRLCISGAGPLPVEILRAFNERFPGVPLIEGYGLSEASPVVSINPIQGPWIAGTIGTPIPGVEITIRDENLQPVPDGVDGELCVRGGNVMLGYWRDPAKTAETLVDGWLRTGDIGHRRPDGYFVITDRKKDMLKPNGLNVYPREIEEVICQFHGIRECAVVGQTDPRRGEVPVAFVVLEEGCPWNEAALLAFLKERLADYKLPRRAEILPALPRNALGKILKTELRQRLGQQPLDPPLT